jgi:hypothetical protein
MNEDERKATDFVADWLAAHRDELGGTDHTAKWNEEYTRTFCAEFDTPTYLVQLCAWDHACCLDIVALNRATTHEDYNVSGDCDGVAGLSARLDTFLHWLDANEPNRDA